MNRKNNDIERREFIKLSAQSTAAGILAANIAEGAETEDKKFKLPADPGLLFWRVVSTRIRSAVCRSAGVRGGSVGQLAADVGRWGRVRGRRVRVSDRRLSRVAEPTFLERARPACVSYPRPGVERRISTR